MGANILSFLQDFETNAQEIVVESYAEMAKNNWIGEIQTELPSKSRKEVVHWLLDTAQIEEIGSAGGSMNFESLDQVIAEYTHKHHGKGLEMSRDDFEDLDAGGVSLGAAWMRQTGAYMGYYPQKLGVTALKAGHNAASIGYDGQVFFSAAHPNNPNNPGAGTYQNIFTGAAAGAYPGACPIDESVSAEVALANLGKLVGYIRGIKGPNGEDPRFIRPKKLVVGPRLMPRAIQLTTASFIAQAATGGAGSADVKELIESLGLMRPVVADELSGFENDTTFFLGGKGISTAPIGGLVLVKRKDFEINFYTGSAPASILEAILNRADKFQWQCKGRMSVQYGHPYELFKCKGS